MSGLASTGIEYNSCDSDLTLTVVEPEVIPKNPTTSKESPLILYLSLNL